MLAATVPRGLKVERNNTLCYRSDHRRQDTDDSTHDNIAQARITASDGSCSYQIGSSTWSPESAFSGPGAALDRPRRVGEGVALRQ